MLVGDWTAGRGVANRSARYILCVLGPSCANGNRLANFVSTTHPVVFDIHFQHPLQHPALPTHETSPIGDAG